MNGWGIHMVFFFLQTSLMDQRVHSNEVWYFGTGLLSYQEGQDLDFLSVRSWVFEVSVSWGVSLPRKASYGDAVILGMGCVQRRGWNLIWWESSKWDWGGDVQIVGECWRKWSRIGEGSRMNLQPAPSDPYMCCSTPHSSTQLLKAEHKGTMIWSFSLEAPVRQTCYLHSSALES